MIKNSSALDVENPQPKSATKKTMFFNEMRVTSPVFRSGNNTQQQIKNALELK
jgi:hypothetical protein